MTSFSKTKEQMLLDKIKKTKDSLNKLRDKRKKEIGDLAVKAGLGEIDNQTLKTAFEKLATELSNVHSN